MSNAKHTPEPWRVEIGEQPESIAVLCTSGLAHFEIVSDSHLGDIHADARRIVACVNACAGIPTGYLEAALNRGFAGTAYFQDIHKQREKLLASLKLCIKYDGQMTEEQLRAANTAIAKAKGE